VSAHGQHAGGGEHEMRPRATRPQLVAMTVLTIFLLAAGTAAAARFGDFSMTAETMTCENGRFDMKLSTMPMSMEPMKMCGVVMPPGMVMNRGVSLEALEDMAAVDEDEVEYTAPVDARGDRPLEASLDGGVKVYRLTTSLIRWNILRDREVLAYAFNRQVPGPRVRVAVGDRVRFLVRNELPEPTSVHWHGLVLPNAMDGAADVTQRPIAPGGTFTYEFTVPQPGTFFYHSHFAPDRQQALGLHGALIVDPKRSDPAQAAEREAVLQLGQWTVRGGYTFPSMPMEGSLPNFFTINGKAYPETEPIRMRVGERLLVRFIGSNSLDVHPMHIHGGPFRIVETDGNPVPRAAQIAKDTVLVGAGERYNVVWTARRPGRWLLHCHINHHITNDNVEVEGGGGLTMVIDVRA
jgi:FtsP/CotA-like multicopper oxidase with cupredoxin domain